MTSKTLYRESIGGQNRDRFLVGVASMQGLRTKMEDAHTVVSELASNNDDLRDASFVGVFDGHGGSSCAHWCASNLSTYISRIKSIDDIGLACLKADVAFVNAESARQQQQQQQQSSSNDGRPNHSSGGGSTAVFAIIDQMPPPPPPPADQSSPSPPPPSETCYRVRVGNIGDSRAIIVSPRAVVAPVTMNLDGVDTNLRVVDDGNSNDVVATVTELTRDHMPSDKDEHERIVAAGGRVASGRVDGELAMSRAMGDSKYKRHPTLAIDKQKVIALPDVTVGQFGQHDFLLLFCDGVIDSHAFHTADDIATFVVETMNSHPDIACDPAALMGALVSEALKRGSQDNITAMMVMPSPSPSPFAPSSTTVGQMRDDWDDAAQVADSSSNRLYSSIPLKEYIPGEYTAFKSSKCFAEAYSAEAAKHGLTAEQAQLLHDAKFSVMSRRRSSRPRASTAADIVGDDDSVDMTYKFPSPIEAPVVNPPSIVPPQKVEEKEEKEKKKEESDESDDERHVHLYPPRFRVSVGRQRTGRILRSVRTSLNEK
ncbi:MAG: hypothetical protein WC763_07120 [Candidatus Paceibacterota bacterium]